jgi:hypothetical protein
MDTFLVIDNGYINGEKMLYPLLLCMFCGTEIQDFGDDYEDDMIVETLEQHKERCQRFRE